MKPVYHQSKNFNATNTKRNSGTNWDGNRKIFFRKILSSCVNSVSFSEPQCLRRHCMSVAVGAQPASLNLSNLLFCWLLLIAAAGLQVSTPLPAPAATPTAAAPTTLDQKPIADMVHTRDAHMLSVWQTVGNKTLYFHRIPLSEILLFVIVLDDAALSYHSLRCGCF